MSTSDNKQQVEKPLNRAIWWAVFLAATYTMSLWFQAFREFTLQPTLLTSLFLMGVTLLVALLLVVLVYDSYVQEKSRGKVEKPLKLFEWMMNKRILLRVSSPTKGKN